MTVECTHCDDTGSLSKDIEGSTDCVYCTIAGERAGLEIWALRHGLRAGIADLWLIYQHGRNRGLDYAADICEAMNDSSGDAAAYDQREQNNHELEREGAISACVAAIRAKRGSKN